MGLTREQYFLMKLAEECTEVGQRALKQVQYGKNESQGSATSVPSETHPGVVFPTNAQRLREEVNDALVIIRILEIMGELPKMTEEDFSRAYAAKYAKLKKYMDYSIRLGLTEEDILAP